MKKLEDFKNEQISFVSFKNGKSCELAGGVTLEKAMRILKDRREEDLLTGIATINHEEVSDRGDLVDQSEAEAIERQAKSMSKEIIETKPGYYEDITSW